MSTASRQVGAALVAALLVVAAVWFVFQREGQSDTGQGGSPALYAANDIATAVQAAVSPNSAPGEVTVSCQDAPRRAGSISDCSVQWVDGGAKSYRVEFLDAQGQFTAYCECKNAYGDQITHDGAVG